MSILVATIAFAGEPREGSESAPRLEEDVLLDGRVRVFYVAGLVFLYPKLMM